MAQKKQVRRKTPVKSKKSKKIVVDRIKELRALQLFGFVFIFSIIGIIFLLQSDAATPKNCEAGSSSCNYIGSTYSDPVQSTVDAVKRAQNRDKYDKTSCGGNPIRGCGDFGLLVGGVGIQSSEVEKSPQPGTFSFTGNYSHSANNDPIVFPGSAGASHEHDFFGNTTLDHNSTTDSLVKAKTINLNLGDYAGEQVGDASSYWFPAVYQDGKKIEPFGSTIYYRVSKGLEGSSSAGKEKVQPFPTGLRMIAGNAKATASNQRESVFFKDACGGGGNTIGKTNMITSDCGKIQMVLNFPSWWDCKNLDSPDHKSHMSYTKSSSHSCPVPEIQVFVQYRTNGGSGFKLTSGEWYTGHGDFWNAWDPALLKGLVDNIMNVTERNDAARLKRAGSTEVIQTSEIPSDPIDQTPTDGGSGDGTSSGGGSTSTVTLKPPVNLKSEILSPTEVVLTWDDNNSAQYIVYRDSVRVNNVYGARIKDTGVEAGKSYSYTVQSVDAAGNKSNQSEPLNVTMPQPQDTEGPSAPGDFKAYEKNGIVILQWTAATDNVGVTGYNINKDGNYYSSVSENTFSFGDSNVEPGKTYVYRVRAKDAAGNVGSNSQEITVTISKPEPVNNGVIQGRVTDNRGKRISNVTIEVSNSNKTYTASTNSYGHFYFGNVVPGDYEVIFTHRRYETVKRNVTLESGGIVRINDVEMRR